MTLAKLIPNSQDWDEIQIVVKGDISRIISLNNRHSALELNRLLTIAYFEKHQGTLSVDIDGTNYTFEQASWHAILRVMDEWLGEFIGSEYPEFYEDNES